MRIDCQSNLPRVARRHIRPSALLRRVGSLVVVMVAASVCAQTPGEPPLKPLSLKLNEPVSAPVNERKTVRVAKLEGGLGRSTGCTTNFGTIMQ